MMYSMDVGCLAFCMYAGYCYSFAPVTGCEGITLKVKLLKADKSKLQ